MRLYRKFKELPLKKKIAAVVLPVLFLVFLVKFGLWLHYRYTHAITEDAFVEADIINVSPLVPGHIKKILVDESEHVKKGQLLFVLDDRDYAAEVRLRKAQLEAARKDYESLLKKLEQARKDLELTKLVLKRKVEAARNALLEAKAALERAEKDYRRFSALYRKRVVGKRKLDLVTEEYKRMKALYKVRLAEYRMAQDSLIQIEIKKEKVKELESLVKAAVEKVKAARRALEAAQVRLDHTRVRSPVDGVVAKKYLFEGDFVSPGIPVLAVYDPKTIYVIANLEETRFRGVDVGDPVDIKVDAYPGRVFRGRVKKILRASAAKFALIPRDVTAGEFTKVVQRIPIKIEILDENRDLLIPGMSVEVGIKR